jgi:TRAP-type C4-dicarboxylate transport system permease small subunit
MLRRIDRIGSAVAGALLAIAALALFALVPMAGWLVFGRYVLNASPTWVEATSLVLILVVTFGVAAAATRSEDHLAIHFIRESFPPPIERAMRLASHAILTVFGVYMMVASWENVLGTWYRPIPLLGIPEGVRHIPLVVGGAGIAAFSFIHVLKILFLRERPVHPDPDDAAG